MRQRDREQLVRPAVRDRRRPSLAVDDVVEIAAGSAYQKRSLNDSLRPVGALAVLGASRSSVLARPSCSISRSALYQSALISTALPRRGVTTQSSTFASIHVS